MQPSTKLHKCQGFSLVEVLIATALSSVLLAAVMTSFLFITRSGANLAHYSLMEHESHRGLERFAQDVREASGIEWTSATQIQLNFPTGTPVVYKLGGAKNNEFIRTQGGADATLVTFVTGMSFVGYNLAGAELDPADIAVSNAETKQLQLRLLSKRQSITAAAATNRVLSARFILRNKQVSS